MEEEILAILKANTFTHTEFNEEGPDYNYTSVSITLDELAKEIADRIKSIDNQAV